MPSKKKTIEILETFKNYVLSNDSIPDDSDDEPIEAVKPNAKPNVKQAPKKEVNIEVIPEIKQAEPITAKHADSVRPETVAQKKKRIQSEAQKLNTQKMREKLAEAQQRKKEEKAEREAMERAILDEKIVKKAISIKKKQIKKEKVLDEISDDETPMEEIVKKIRPTKAPEVKPPVPVYTQPAPPKFTLKFHK
jgi:hypothetical protein